MDQHKPCIILFGLIVLIFSNIQNASCYSWHSDWELWDLEKNDANFLDEVNAWSATKLIQSGIKYSLCAGTYLMGGYNVLGGTKNQYFERTYTGLPPHNQLNLSYVAYAIDSWDGHSADDHFEVYIDGYYQIGWRFSCATPYGQLTCGDTGRTDYPPVLAVSTFIHNASTLTIRFISMLDQVSYDESLGIRDVKMQFVNVTTPQYSLCGRSTTNVPLPGWPCDCDSSHQFQNVSTSGTCFECSESCATCSATETSCTSCSSEKFLASNICYPTCTYPLFVTESEGVNYCNTPCSGGQYAMWDSSCSLTCPEELNSTTISGFSVCTFPCSLTPASLNE